MQQTDEPSRRTGALYARLWRQVPRELGFLLLALPIAIAGLAVLNGIFWPGVGTLIIYVGLFVLVAALYVARGFGTLELVRLSWSGNRGIARPRWRADDKPRSFLRATFGPLIDGHYWLYLLHGLIINPIVSIVSWTLTVVWVSTALGGVTYWFWDRFIPHGGQDVFLSRTVFGAFFPEVQNPFDPIVGDAVLYFVAGVLFLATLPFLTRGLTLLHAAIARGVLGAWRSEELRREVADLSASRNAAVSAEDRSLRRLERDIHDGPQQRLVRLQMDIASATRRLETEPDAARELLEQAALQAHDALEELRALSRGFAPPILQDRGLVVALESLVARSSVPTSFDNELAEDGRFSPELERSAYFVAAELLTNVAKHSGASAARLHVKRDIDPVTGAPTLEISVSDNGRGDAILQPGHGLSGLEERLRGLRGSMQIESPAGGPTEITGRVPIADAPAAEPRASAPDGPPIVEG